MPLPEINLQPSTTLDLDSITNVALAGLPDDPVWPYRFPYASKYPDEHGQYTRKRFSEYLAGQEAGTYKIFLAAFGSTTVGLAIWQLHDNAAPESDKESKPSDRYERPDCDPSRMKVFRDKLIESKTRWFDERYGSRQLHLTILCTHPEYRRLGVATKLVEWGISKAQEEKSALTLFSSPMGKSLYSKLNFREVGLCKAQVPGDQNSVDILGMVRDFSDL